jgi:hypothetical protein
MAIFTQTIFALLVIGGLVYAQDANPYNYTIINGQIFTPGLAIVDAPQPNTPLGGGMSCTFVFTTIEAYNYEIFCKSRWMSVTMAQ